MNQEDRNLLVGLTENQATLLKTVFIKRTASSGESGLSGHGLGRIVSSLQQKGFITPIGKKNRQYKWKPTEEWKEKLTKYNDEILELLKEIEN